MKKKVINIHNFSVKMYWLTILLCLLVAGFIAAIIVNAAASNKNDNSTEENVYGCR